MDKEMHNKVEELQMLEGQLQASLAQKQGLQIEMNEIDNAIGELKNSEGDVYRVVSGVMLKSDRDGLSKELNEKKKALGMKIDAMEKQEKKLEQDASALREEVNKAVSKK